MGMAGAGQVAPSSPRIGLIEAAPHWRSIDFISDLHLQAEPAATFELWQAFMLGTDADALFILGDLFEVWIGDDAVLDSSGATSRPFEGRCLDLMRTTAGRMPVYFMPGNRDFLLGSAALESCGVQGLDDPALLVLGPDRFVLTHGDALCLSDLEYQAFRTMVRSDAWQSEFLGLPVAERRGLARQMREKSAARQKSGGFLAEVDADSARRLLQDRQARTMIHGHTHRPADHDLGRGLKRVVLSDWDGSADPPRSQVLRLDATGWQRLSLAEASAQRGR